MLSLHSKPVYQRGIKLLQKIFVNIINNPKDEKYQNVNFKAISKRLEDDILIQLLMDSGFTKSDNCDRLLFDITKLDHLKIVNDKLSKLISNASKMEVSLKQIVSMGFDEDRARSALKRSDYNVENAVNDLINPYSATLNVDSKRTHQLNQLFIHFENTRLVSSVSYIIISGHINMTTLFLRICVVRALFLNQMNVKQRKSDKFRAILIPSSA